MIATPEQRAEIEAQGGHVRRIEHRGGVYRLRKHFETALKSGVTSKEPFEFVVEGPRGTGKSNGTGYLLWKICRNYPQLRILVIRTARSLLTDTFCKTYEEDICPQHLSISQTARMQRHEYHFPRTDSRIVLGGLDEPERYYGSDWDVIVTEEAVKFSWKHVEPFLGSLRNGKLPFHALIYPTNPDAPRNWVNMRCQDKGGPAVRLKCIHKDNPSLWNWDTKDWEPKGTQFMSTLGRFTGVQKDRHVLGLWKGAEGMVWDNFDEDVHVIDLPASPREDLGILECRAAVDFGRAVPGCISVWGIDKKKRVIEVAEVYHTRKSEDWWASWLVRLVQEFHIRRVVCDPSGPVQLLNEWLTKAGIGAIAYGANNKKASSPGGDLGGLDLVRWGFEKDEDGIPRIRMIRNCQRGGVDPDLLAANKPTCGVQEIPSYVNAQDENGEFRGDQTDKSCPDHFCDTLRYLFMDVWRVNPKYEAPKIVYPIGTDAALFGTVESLALERARRDAGEADGY